MKKYLVIYERSKDGYSAYVPDLPGCTTAASNRKEAEINMVEAIKLYLDELKEDGSSAPEPASEAAMLSI